MPHHPIAITGMHRSGTSMITRALHDSGMHLIAEGAEDLVAAAEDNPEGFWENKAIVACNDELLEAAGGAWDSPPALPPLAVDDPRVAHVAETGTAALAALSVHDRWGFKDPRTCLTAAYWLDMEPRLRFIVCVRHPLEVALSLRRRNQNSYSLGLSLWERYYASVLEQVPPERRIVTHYDTFFVDADAEIARLCAFAGLEPAPARVRRDLRHHTVGVSLADAGVSPAVQALYRDLCREAGAPVPPTTPTDEGRVRRLILDGAVAQRHAEQRQAAIDRLHEREAELRASYEERHRERVRELEGQLAAARKGAMLQQETVDALRALAVTVESIHHSNGALAVTVESIHRSTGAIEERVRRIDEHQAMTIGARLARDLARDGRRAARAGVRRLPPPAGAVVRRGWRVARRGVDAPGPTARSVSRKAVRSGRARVDRLPPPVREALLRGGTRSRRALRAPVPSAKAAARRLPPPAQDRLRSAWIAARRLEPNRSSARRTDAPAPAPTPKGPAPSQWMTGYQHMVRAAWPGDDPWLAVAPGSPRQVREARPTRATPFPSARQGAPFADDLSHIAHLEALRFAGHAHLVVPEGSRPWFRQQAELRDHVVRTYRLVVDAEDAGLVFDLSAPAHAEVRSLRSEVDRFVTDSSDAPVVLDWTDLAVGRELPGISTFRPLSPAGPDLPYLDHSVDVVVTTEERDGDEARRVAARGVITVAPGRSGVEVRAVTRRSAPAERPSGRVVVWTPPVSGSRWEADVGARVERAGGRLVLAPLGVGGPPPELDDGDVLVVLEPFVLPFPGAIEAMAARVAAHPDTAVTGKVLAADGRLESVGGTVFSDRSVALIAGASGDVRGPWHDYARPVCWAPGLLAMSSAVWSGTPAVAGEGRSFLREWCAALWAQGGTLLYHPSITAVRVSGDGREPSVPLDASLWQRVLDLRPARPLELGDGAWRDLLAHDDVEACRR